MSHVDEGLLHAYLDGAFPLGHAQAEEIEAHLAVCVDCRVRLEDARALRDRSQMVLRHAAPPDVRIPPFEELRARRGGGAAAPVPSTKRGWLPPHRLAWAASLVLALGAGWMANDLVRSSAPTASESFEVKSFATERDESPRSPAADASSAGAAATDLEKVQTQPPPPTSLTDRVESESLLRENAGGDMGRRSEVAAPVGSQRSVVQAEAAPPTGAARVEAAAAKAVDPARRLTTQQSRDTASNALRMRGGVRGGQAAPPAAAPPLSRSANETILPLELREVVLSAASSDAVALLLNDYVAASTASGWQAETPSTASGRIGRDLASIGGLDAQAVEVARVETRDLVRTLYRIEGGTTVELVQRAAPAVADARFRQDAASDALALAPAMRVYSSLEERSPLFRGQAVVALQRPGLVLLLKGPVPQDSLVSLATRVR